MSSTCLCKNRPRCIWCGEKFSNHGLLIIHSKIDLKTNILNCSMNPYVLTHHLDYQKRMNKE